MHLMATVAVDGWLLFAAVVLVVVATFLLNGIGCLNKLFNKHVIYAFK